MQQRRVRRGAWLVPGTAALAMGLMAPAPAGAQGPVPAGAEFQVNTHTTSAQNGSCVEMDAYGDFVVVWFSYGSSGTDQSSWSIQGQRYGANGSALGTEFQINTYTPDMQSYPSVAVDSNGDFVVVWQSDGSSGTDTSLDSILGQRYASDGSAQGAEFQVNTYTTNDQRRPAVATAASGAFVVVWQSDGSPGTDTSSSSIQGQRYASDGSAQGAQFQVNTYTMSNQTGASVAADADGNFVVVWESYGSPETDTSYGSIQGQRFASDGSAQGTQFQVNTYSTDYQVSPSVAVDADGDFVVAWDSLGSPGTDASSYSIQGQRYASDGSPRGIQFQVNEHTTSYQRAQSVAAEPDGDFVVVWQSLGSAGPDTSSYSIWGQRYASDGSTQGAQFQVNTHTPSYQLDPSVAMDTDGDFVVAWDSLGSSGTDTSSYSVQGQRFRRPATPVPAMSLSTRFALGAALLLLGAIVARAYGSVSRRSRFSR